MTTDYSYLRGKIHEFEDGVKLRIVDVKMREAVQWISYETIYSGALPRRFVTKAPEFIETYGHLFSDV